MLPVGQRDIVVIGASAGGLAALKQLLPQLPRDLGAAVFVAVHSAPMRKSHLAALLNQPRGLLAHEAIHGERIVPGRVYVGPPDMHLMVGRGVVRVEHGPRENGHRPSVDALFRTAAQIYDARVIAIVLSGYLDCGTSGMQVVHDRRGVCVAQDPEEAEAPDMPQSAIRHVPVDFVRPVASMGELIRDLVSGAATAATPNSGPAPGEQETLAPELTCPECQGVLKFSQRHGHLLYRCHVGHTFSDAAIEIAQGEAVERSLWAAVRALEESAGLAQRLAARATGSLRERFEERETSQRAHAKVVRDVILSQPSAPAPPLDQPEEISPKSQES